MDEYEIYEIFRHFGQIHQIYTNSSQNFKITYVSITDDLINCEFGEITLEGKSFAFRSIGYDIEDIVIDPSVARRINQYLNDELAVAPAQDSPKNLVNVLSDACLLRIFNELGAFDLINTANVCKRFNHIAKQTFESRYHQIDRSLMHDLRCERSGLGFPMSLYQIELCLKTFGPELLSFDIVGDSNPEIILRFCVEYCTKIEAFALYKAWNASIESNLRHLIPRLKQLQLKLSSAERIELNEFACR